MFCQNKCIQEIFSFNLNKNSYQFRTIQRIRATRFFLPDSVLLSRILSCKEKDSHALIKGKRKFLNYTFHPVTTVNEIFHRMQNLLTFSDRN